MSAKKLGVEGFRYLYQRGRSYELRVQVPASLRAAVGKGELKRSFGSDFKRAKREYGPALSQFMSVIDQARPRSGDISIGARAAAFSEPDTFEIELACYSHFTRMVQKLRGRAVHSSSDGGSSRLDRIEGFKAMLQHQLDAAEMDAWTTMTAQADWLCEEKEWTIDPASSAYKYLCEALMRGRIQAYRNELRRLEGRLSADADADPLFGSQPPKPTASVTLGQMVVRFKAAKQHKWSLSTRKNYAIIFRVIEEICGSNTAVSSVDHDFCVGVWNSLKGLPAHFQKHPATRGRSIAEAIRTAADTKMRTISPATINGHLNKLGAVIRYGREKGWIIGNPMEDIEEPDPIADDEKRDAFSIEQLNLLFACEPWRSGFKLDDPRPSRYWAPLIALYSGARLSEVCGQRVDEMITERGVKAFHFRHRPDDRSIKNGSGRKVPVHPELIRLGFWEFVEEAHKSKQLMLFTDVRRDRLGSGLIDHSQKMMVAARAMAEKNTVGHRS